MDGALVVSCAHCGFQMADEWELLDANKDHEIRCEGCGKQFHARIVECPHCVADNVLVGAAAAPPADGATCKSCGTPLVFDGEEADDAIM